MFKVVRRVAKRMGAGKGKQMDEEEGRQFGGIWRHLAVDVDVGAVNQSIRIPVTPSKPNGRRKSRGKRRRKRRRKRKNEEEVEEKEKEEKRMKKRSGKANDKRRRKKKRKKENKKKKE